eukprot:gene7008-115_t
MEVIGPPLELCRVPVPAGYSLKAKYPDSLWQISYANIPKAALWESIKSDQSWVVINGDKLDLPRKGGSGAASDFLKMIPPTVDKTKIRTILDEGAGVCGLGAEVMATWAHRPTVLSYAPHDTHASQVQVCAERGVPSILFSMARHWVQSTSIGAWYQEVDRVLRPGGYFAIFAEIWHLTGFKEQTEHWTQSMGWKMMTDKNSKGMGCTGLGIDRLQPSQDVDQPSFRKYHAACRFPIVPQPQLPETSKQYGDVVAEIVQAIVKVVGGEKSKVITNVLDGNSQGGVLAAAVRAVLPFAWVLGVQPVTSTEYHHKGVGRTVNFGGSGNDATIHPSVGNLTYGYPDGLPTSFSRGEVGIYHDWCYMFPTYPRAFDMVIFRDYEPHRNCFLTLILEFDRIIRPGGYLVFSGEGFAEELDPKNIGLLGWRLCSAASANPDLKNLQIYEKVVV